MHSHHVALALADARVADLQRASIHSTATMSAGRHRRHLRALALLGLAATAALAPTNALARPMEGAVTPASAHVDGAPAPKPARDLRSPDTRDAAQTAQPRQDLQSPDARDAAEGRGTYNSPHVVIVKVPQPSPPAVPEPSSAGGIDWVDAGIGAGSLLGLSLLGLGGALVIVHRRRAAHGASPVASH